MSYLVLARKYRPRTFAEVAGQELLTKTLQGAISEGRVGHAYLFTGPRGTGKTTSARIFAKALNCERGPCVDPCGECERCLSVDSGADVDVVEIDAASNTGVENIRDLREQAAYTPMRARFKVFIIDEVHMLSKGAFNALLKTLEEPPAHVKFLFATTELNKVPDTILSRCQVLRLALFREEVIAARLTQILILEKVRAGQGVVEGLARLARGSMRDALSIADQLLALVGDEPTALDVARLAGASAASHVEELIEALLLRDGARALETLGPAEGGESEWLSAILRDLRGALLIQVCRDDSTLTGDFAADRERLTRIGATLGPARLQLWMEELLAARERIENVPSLARTVLELTLLELCRDENSVPLALLVQRLAAMEQRLASASARVPQVAVAPPHSADRPQVLRPLAPPEPSTPAPALITRPAAALPPPPATPGARATGNPPVQRFGSRPVPTTSAPAILPTPAQAPANPLPPVARELAAPPMQVHSPARMTRGAVGTKPTWESFLARLAAEHPQLAELFERRGQLLDISEDRAHVQVKQLRADERTLFVAQDTHARCLAAFEAVLGARVTLVLEDIAQRQPGADDAFTSNVAGLFGGHIEDKS